jgi:signal transduction histidine kinase
MNDRLMQTANWVILGLGGLVGVLFVTVIIRFFKRTSERRKTSQFAAPAVNPSNDQQFMLATFQGVIQRQKDQERELERLRRLEKERADLSQKINENITRNMPTGLVTINRSGIINSSNPAAKEILEFKVLENMHCQHVLPATPAFARMVEDCLQTGQRFHRVEMEAVVHSTRQKTLGISISPIESNREGISGVVCLISDLTQLAALQSQVRLKEGLAYLGEMSAGIAHEFKNSLATISGYAQLLGDEPLPAVVDNNLRMIRREATQLTTTINKFLGFAKPQQPNRLPLDLNELLRASIEEFQVDPRFKHIEYSFEGHARPYAGDGSLLKSAFTNLLLNASESIPQNRSRGHVSSRLLDMVGNRVHKILLKIIDDGCGIPAEDLGKIFIPFFTSKSAGSGLGLAIVQKIILIHDGKIEVESKPGEGTCMNVYL